MANNFDKLENEFLQQKFDYFTERCGKRIKEERIKAGLSQDELGSLINTSRQTISKWERGESYPETNDIFKLSIVFHCDYGFLVGDYFCRHQPESDIHNRTGLSEKAIENLSMLLEKGYSSGIMFLNYLLEHPDFSNAIEYVEKYKYFSIQGDFHGKTSQFFEDTNIYGEIKQMLDFAISEKSNLSSAKLSLNDAMQLCKLSIQDYLQDAIRDALKGLIQNGSDTRTKE